MNKRPPLIPPVTIIGRLFATLDANKFITKSNLGLNEVPYTVPNLSIQGLQNSPEFLIKAFSHNTLSFAYTDIGFISDFSVSNLLFEP